MAGAKRSHGGISNWLYVHGTADLGRAKGTHLHSSATVVDASRSQASWEGGRLVEGGMSSSQYRDEVSAACHEGGVHLGTGAERAAGG